MKNAGFSILCCIFVLIISVSVKLAFNKTKNNEQFTYSGNTINVYMTKNKEYIEMDLEDYVLCVLRAEMPAEFEIDALKAQAVAIRTYTLKKADANNEMHPKSPVCDDFNHCMAFIDEEKCKENWGDKFSKYNSKLVKAVNETRGEIVTYDNQPITAVFHAVSSGKTENSNEIWAGPEIPYLRSVSSEADLKAEGYSTTVTVSREEFLNKLNINSVSDISYDYTTGGSVKSLKLNNSIFTGNEIRNLFNLRSTNFSLELNDDNVVFNVKGYGHGVGMSQRGANEYAKQGLKYDEILKKYYSGVEIKKQGV